MPQSHCHIIVHIVFSTKDRRKLITAAVRPQLHAYLSAVVRDLGCECYRVGGIEDHVHLAIRISSQTQIATLIEKIKVPTSQWMKKQGPGLRLFSWQRGYGAFSISPQYREELFRYIDHQEDHHRTVTYEDEFRGFLKRYEITYDERYVWD
jgi:putative transposase